MPTDHDFPLELNATFVRYCRRLNREYRACTRIGVASNKLPQIFWGESYDRADDLLFEEGGARIVVSREDAEDLRGWKLIGKETLHEDFSFYRISTSGGTASTHPGRLSLDRRMMVQIEPELRGERLQEWKERDEDDGTSRVKGTFDAVAQHIDRGDTRAAIVLRVTPNVLVAAYTDELDCVAVLKFPARTANVFRLKPGMRLVTCNFYRKSNEGVAPDLYRDPDAPERWQNFHPVIGNFVSSDSARLQQLANEIPEREWQRTQGLGDEWLDRFDAGQTAPRNGSPLLSVDPVIAAEPATFVRRLLAFGIDLILLTLIMTAIAWFVFGFDEIVAQQFRNPGAGPARQQFEDAKGDIRLATVLSYLFYCPFMLASGWHATVGKKLLGLRVVDQETFEGVGIEQAGERIFAFIPSITLGALGCVSMLWSATNQAWHDKRAGTLVVRQR